MEQQVGGDGRAGEVIGRILERRAGGEIYQCARVCRRERRGNHERGRRTLK